MNKRVRKSKSSFIFLIHFPAIVEYLDSKEWRNEISARRTQQYGYRYEYVSAEADEKIEPIPEILDAISLRLLQLKYFDSKPDQMYCWIYSDFVTNYF